MYAHCKTIFGINIVLNKYETNQPIKNPEATFRTGNIVDNNDVLNGVYTGTAENDSTDGTVEKNFKSCVVDSINKKTDTIIEAGFPHNGKHFKIDINKEVNAIVLFLQRMMGQDMTGMIFRAEGEDYIFVNNDDFDLWFATGADTVQRETRTGADLKNDLTLAENTEEAMASIIGANNAR